MIKDGSRVIGLYGGNAIIGEVLTSRYYNKELLYTVKLDNPISFRWRNNLVDIVLMSDNELKEAPIAECV